MPARRSGSPTSFWDNASVGSNGTSSPVRIAQLVEQICFYVTASGGTEITVEVAHSGSVNSDGTDKDDYVNVWHPLAYINDAVKLTFSTSGSKAFIVPDFAPGWVRLKSSNAVTITAGHEATGE